MARADRKPRRNIQYKDLAGAVAHADNLEFLEDVIPKTTPYRQIKGQAARTRANFGLSGGVPGNDTEGATTDQLPGDTSGEAVAKNGGGGGKKHRSSASRSSLNGGAASFVGASGARIVIEDDDEGPEMDPADQLHQEMRQARAQGDVHMTG